MDRHSLDLLLTRMPEIAAAVNAFSSESIQKQAFSALISALADDHPHLQRVLSESPFSPENNQMPEARKGEAVVAAPDADPPPAPGKLSFDDFIAWKKPGDNQSRFAVAIYWLQEHAGAKTVSSEDIRQLFRTTKDWSEPRNLNSALSVCASRKATIDVAKRSDIKLTPKGRNFVENELPRPTRQRSRP